MFKVTFLPQSEARFELQQVIETIPTVNILRCCHAFGSLHICVEKKNLMKYKFQVTMKSFHVSEGNSKFKISVSSHGVQVLILHFCECNLTGLDGFKLKLCGVFGHEKKVGGKIEL